LREDPEAELKMVMLPLATVLLKAVTIELLSKFILPAPGIVNAWLINVNEPEELTLKLLKVFELIEVVRLVLATLIATIAPLAVTE
jgi:hypothetical protein